MEVTHTLKNINSLLVWMNLIQGKTVTSMVRISKSFTIQITDTSAFPKCMISRVVVFDGWVMGVVHDDVHQWLLGSCVKFSQTAVVVVKYSVRSYWTVTEMGRLIFRAFRCEIELDYITVSSLLLVSVAKCLWKHKELVSVNLSWLQSLVGSITSN